MKFEMDGLSQQSVLLTHPHYDSIKKVFTLFEATLFPKLSSCYSQ